MHISCPFNPKHQKYKLLEVCFYDLLSFLVAIYDQREGTHHDRLHKYHASWLIVFLELKYYTNIWYFQTYAKRDMVFTAKIGMYKNLYIEEIDSYNTENKLHIIKSSTWNLEHDWIIQLPQVQPFMKWT